MCPGIGGRRFTGGQEGTLGGQDMKLPKKKPVQTTLTGPFGRRK